MDLFLWLRRIMPLIIRFLVRGGHVAPVSARQKDIHRGVPLQFRDPKTLTPYMLFPRRRKDSETVQR